MDGWIMRKKTRKTKEPLCIDVTDKMKSRARLSKYTTPKGNEKNQGANGKITTTFHSAGPRVSISKWRERGEEEEELSFR